MITPVDFEYERINFPSGEMHIRVKSIGDNPCIVFDFQKNEEIIELLLIADAIRGKGRKLETLTLFYMPFGRQDRRAVEGDCFSLKVFADLINQIGFRKVYINDPHSDVTTALIDNCTVITQTNLFYHIFHNKRNFNLICPDGGALKKIYQLADLVRPSNIIQCSKKRDVQNGNITGVQVFSYDLEGRDCYIVDDICDGGRTFIEIAKELKKINCGKIILLVSHGLFTKGLEVFDGLIDEIYTGKGKVK